MLNNSGAPLPKTEERTIDCGANIRINVTYSPANDNESNRDIVWLEVRKDGVRSRKGADKLYEFLLDDKGRNKGISKIDREKTKSDLYLHKMDPIESFEHVKISFPAGIFADHKEEIHTYLESLRESLFSALTGYYRGEIDQKLFDWAEHRSDNFLDTAAEGQLAIFTGEIGIPRNKLTVFFYNQVARSDPSQTKKNVTEFLQSIKTLSPAQRENFAPLLVNAVNKFIDQTKNYFMASQRKQSPRLQ